MKSDNFILGDFKSTCDVCGFDFKGSKLRKRWDGAMVCSKDFELRHPQDLIKIRGEKNDVRDARIPPDPHFAAIGENTADKL